jgi:hypothetical protein
VFAAEHRDKVEERVAKEQQHRLRKQAKAGQAEESKNDAQGALDLADPDGDDEEADAGEESSA